MVTRVVGAGGESPTLYINSMGILLKIRKDYARLIRPVISGSSKALQQNVKFSIRVFNYSLDKSHPLPFNVGRAV